MESSHRKPGSYLNGTQFSQCAITNPAASASFPALRRWQSMWSKIHGSVSTSSINKILSLQSISYGVPRLEQIGAQTPTHNRCFAYASCNRRQPILRADFFSISPAGSALVSVRKKLSFVYSDKSSSLNLVIPGP